MRKVFIYIVAGCLVYLPVRCSMAENIFGLRRFVITHKESGESITHISFNDKYYVMSGNHFFLPDTNYYIYKSDFLNEYGLDIYWDCEGKSWVIKGNSVVESKLDTTKYQARMYKVGESKNIKFDSKKMTFIHCAYNVLVGLGFDEEIYNIEDLEYVDVSYF